MCNAVVLERSGLHGELHVCEGRKQQLSPHICKHLSSCGVVPAFLSRNVGAQMELPETFFDSWSIYRRCLLGGMAPNYGWDTSPPTRSR